MKTKFTWVGIVTALFVSISTFFIACKKDEVNSVVQYNGQVVYINTTTPFPDLAVKVTDGQNTHCQTKTDAGGTFSLTVRVSEIDGNYYLLAGDETCIPKKVTLGAYGQSEVDLGVIEVEGPALPTVVTNPIQSVYANSAVLGGEVKTDGRMAITARGVCYGTSPYPTVNEKHTTDGTGLGEFTSTLKELEFKTIYYARAYATNKLGTAYGEQVKFTTEEGVAVVVTDSIIRITAHSAKCKGHVTSDGGFPVTKRGTCWSKSPDPTVDDDCTDDGSGLGEFTSTMKNLTENTTYYVRTYATNSTSTTYGEQIIITTLDGLAVVKTDSVSAITANSCSAYGTVVSDCDIQVTARGFCYSTTQYPTVENDFITVGKGLGVFQGNITKLQIGTTYYIRTYATNETGTTYGQQIEFSTKDGLPVVLTKDISSTATTIAIQGEVTETWGFSVTERGFVYSHDVSEPTIENAHVESGKGKGVFNATIRDLLPETTYNVRAYATNENGTSYGSTVKIQTKNGSASIILGDLSEITAITATTSITVENLGGASTLQSCGICWSTIPNPTIEDNSIEAGGKSLNTTYKCTMPNLTPNTTYYVCAYATTEINTTYSAQKTFTTKDGLPTVVTTEIGENITDSTIISGGQVIDDGGFAVTGRGICWSSLPYPTIEDNKTDNGEGIGYYSSIIRNFDWKSNNSCYVRAYATNENGTTYGKQVIVTLEMYEYAILPIIEFGGYIYRIYNDIGAMTWNVAKETCEKIVFGGYDDWKLPSRDEMAQIMQKLKSGWKTNSGTEYTGAGVSARYWTSTEGYQGYHYLYFYDGFNIDNLNSASIMTSYRVRPVRKYKAQ